MLKKALAYRLGSMLIGISINYALFGTIHMAVFATTIFTVALTGYYIIFHALWPEKPASAKDMTYNEWRNMS